MFKKLRQNKKGVTMLVLSLVVTLVALGILIPVGLLVTANIQSTVNTYNLGASGNATRTTLFTNIFQAYNLSAIVPIVAAAGIIISVIIGAFAYMSSRKG